MIEHQLTLKHWYSLAILAICIGIASMQPLEYPSYLLHQIGTVFMLITLFFCLKKIGLTFSSFVLYLGFLAIHVLGAHYLYSYVPYNEWLIDYTGFDLNHAMGWTRNMYDRLVHFSYGLLLYPFLLRLFHLWLPSLKPFALFVLTLQFVMSTSLVYEWIEGLLSLGLSAEDAENYNGQQGDIWDAHKDMLMATFGAIITGVIILILNRRKSE